MTTITPLLRGADAREALSINQRHTVGHLRATAREIAKNLYGIQIETGEVVALQDAFEKALMQFCIAQSDPAVAAEYIAPVAARLKVEERAVAKEVGDEQE